MSQEIKNWSPYQNAIFEAVKDTNDSLLIEAVAGSGKTTTIVEAIRHVPANKTVLFCAFSKAIAEVLGRRIKALNAKCSTLHAVGFSAWRRHIGDDARMLRVEGGKTREILYEEDRYEFQERMWYGREIGRLISLMKSSDLQNAPTSEYDEIVKDLVEFHDLDDEVWDNNGISFAREIFKISVDISRKVIDFDDMLLMPVMEGARFDKYDVVFVDEAQDVNSIQLEMIDRIVAPGGRVIAVGDKNQAIYAWRGALSNSMDEIQKRFHARSLPLSVSYRCPKSVVAKARQFVTHIEPHESAPEGLVHYPGVWNLKNFLPTDAILCRVARPLIETAFLLIRSKVPCKVIGRDIGKNLESIVKKSRCETVEQFEDWLPEFTKREIKKAKDNEAKVAAIYDKVETLHVFTSELRGDDPIQKLLDSINNLFADKYGQMVSLSTVHRCVHPDTLVETCGGLSRIVDIADFGTIATPLGMKSYSQKMKYPESENLCISTRGGYSLTVTKNHGLTVWNGKEDARRVAGELKRGDWLRLRLGPTFDLSRAETWMSFPAAPIKGDVREIVFTVPSEMSLPMAEFLGLMVADGTVFHGGFRLVKRYRSVIDRFAFLVSSLFNVKVDVRDNYSGTDKAEVCSTFLSRWLLSIDGLAPNEKDIPKIILRSSLKVHAAFLKGLFEDGTVNIKDGKVDHVHWDNKSPSVARTVQTMLLRFGIISSVKDRIANGFPVSTLYIYGHDVRIFKEKIGFVAKEKNDRLEFQTYEKQRQHSIPISKEEVAGIRGLLTKCEAQNAKWRGHLSRGKVRDIVERNNRSDQVAFLFERLSWHYTRVESLKKTRSKSVCVTVPNGSRFLQNGFDGWNSKGLEWPRVFILDADKHMPSKWATQPHQVQQEQNLMYVAATRAMSELYYISSEFLRETAVEVPKKEEVAGV